MIKCTIFFFSGTGNTYMAARLLASALNGRGLDASARAIDAINISEIEWEARSADIIGIGYPACGGAPPSPVKKFIEVIPAQKNKKRCFLFCTAHDYAGDGASLLSSKLSERGYDVRQTALFISLPNLNPEHDDDGSRREMRARMQKTAETLAEKIVADEKSVETSFHPIKRARARRSQARLTRGLRVNPAKCNKCGVCAKYCPMGNITVDEGGVKIGSSCCACARCINFCPARAVTLKGLEVRSYTGPYKDFNVADIYKK